MRPIAAPDRESISRLLSHTEAFDAEERRVALELVDDAATNG